MIDRIFMKKFLNESLRPIMDRDYQIRIWVKGMGPECSSLDEAFENLSGDLELIDKDYKSYGISEEEYKILKNLEKEFDHFYYNTNFENDSEIIDSPVWNKVRQLARAAYTMLIRFEN